MPFMILTYPLHSYDNAGLNPIKLGSNKSLIGQGSKGVIIGKGLRITGGAKNIIIQV